MSTQPQTVTDVLSNILQSRVILHNAGEERIEGMFNGHIYKFAPGEDVEVRDILNFPLDRQQKRMKEQPLVVEFRAREVADHLLLRFNDTGLVLRGLMAISGNPELDAANKKVAFEQYKINRVARARWDQAKWLATVEAAKISGGIAPVIPERIREQIMFLQKNERDVLLRDRKRFQCEIDSSQFDTYEEAAAWVLSNYPDHLKKIGTDDPSPFIKDFEAMQQDIIASAKKRIAKQKEREATETKAPERDDSLFLMQKAEELKVTTKLTKAELVGLAKKDKAIIKQVERKLAEIEAEQEAIKTSAPG